MGWQVHPRFRREQQWLATADHKVGQRGRLQRQWRRQGVVLILEVREPHLATFDIVAAVAMGLGVWLLFVASPMLSEAFPQQLAGVLAALVGMIGGSLAPQWIDDHKGHVTHYEGSAS